MKFRLPVLPWGMNDLTPFLTADAIECHYYGHHKAYIDKVNKMSAELGLKNASLEKIILNQDGAIFNNAAQAWNHTFFWHALKPKSVLPAENSPLARAVERAFGSFTDLRTQFLDTAGSLFGSGWTWLVANERGELELINTQNGDNPLRFENARPLWTCDIWEHAYYIDYRNQRREYLEGAWTHINWEFVAANLAQERMPNMSRLMTDDHEAEVQRERL
jgi:Fe-Mn family superoxide dismutase